MRSLGHHRGRRLWGLAMQPLIFFRRIVGDAIAAIIGDVLPALPVRPVNYRSRPGGLGPNQLAWCRAHLMGFAVMEKQVLQSQKGIDNV